MISVSLSSFSVTLGASLLNSHCLSTARKLYVAFVRRSFKLNVRYESGLNDPAMHRVVVLDAGEVQSPETELSLKSNVTFEIDGYSGANGLRPVMSRLRRLKDQPSA